MVLSSNEAPSNSRGGVGGRSTSARVIFGTPTWTSDLEHYAKDHIYPKRIVIALGALQILMGLISFATVHYGFKEWRDRSPSLGAWTLVIFVVLGAVQIYSGLRPSGCSLSVLIGLTACTVVFHLFGSLPAILQYSYKKAKVFAEIMFLLEMILLIVTFSMSCRAACCRGRHALRDAQQQQNNLDANNASATWRRGDGDDVAIQMVQMPTAAANNGAVGAVVTDEVDDGGFSATGATALGAVPRVVALPPTYDQVVAREEKQPLY